MRMSAALVEQIAERKQAGESNKDIAIALGFCTATISRELVKAGLVQRRPRRTTRLHTFAVHHGSANDPEWTEVTDVATVLFTEGFVRFYDEAQRLVWALPVTAVREVYDTKLFGDVLGMTESDVKQFQAWQKAV